MDSAERARLRALCSYADTVRVHRTRLAGLLDALDAAERDLDVMRRQQAPLLASHDALVAAAGLPGAGASAEEMLAAVARARGEGAEAMRAEVARLCAENIEVCEGVLGMRERVTVDHLMLVAGDQGEIRGIQRLAREVAALPFPGDAEVSR